MSTSTTQQGNEMNNYKFFVRNVIINGRVNADYIFQDVDGQAKQTPFIAYSENSPVEQAEEIAKIQNHEAWGGETSKAYFAALKAFMVMGYNSAMTFSVDTENNVSVSF